MIDIINGVYYATNYQRDFNGLLAVNPDFKLGELILFKVMQHDVIPSTILIYSLKNIQEPISKLNAHLCFNNTPVVAYMEREQKIDLADGQTEKVKKLLIIIE